ncbi:MAG: hypothetical protein ACRDQ5_02760 [Sciscionella sp.]
MPVRSRLNPVSGISVGVAVLVLVVLVWLGAAARAGTHPLFYFGLILLGGGAVSLLFAGVGALAVRSRISAGQRLDPRFVAGIRRLVLAMWLCALVLDVLGYLVVLVIAGGRGGTTPLGTGTLIIAFVAGACTVVCAGVTSFLMRRLLPGS